jgi:hypothetical protein
MPERGERGASAPRRNRRPADQTGGENLKSLQGEPTPLAPGCRRRWATHHGARGIAPPVAVRWAVLQTFESQVRHHRRAARLARISCLPPRVSAPRGARHRSRGRDLHAFDAASDTPARSAVAARARRSRAEARVSANAPDLPGSRDRLEWVDNGKRGDAAHATATALCPVPAVRGETTATTGGVRGGGTGVA